MAQNRDWNYHPELPLADKSIWQWPPSPRSIGGYFVRNWLRLSEFMILLLMGVFCWYFLYPDLETTKTFALGWIAQIWLTNLGVMLVSAGGLHWYFYTRRAQAKTLKFSYRDMMRENRTFKFADQVKDNMFWSLTSGVVQVSAYQAISLWLMANGYVPTITLTSNPFLFCLIIFLLPVWSAFHFYWVHRLLHVPFLYTRVHSLHHRNINIGPWSGFSMHPVEHLLYCSSMLIHWIVPSSPVHIAYHVMYLAPGAAMTHTGYESLLIKDKRQLELGTFYHTLHHRYYECNYGNQEMPWDRWFGTFHNGTEEGTRETRDRKKKMYS
jgi:sterol desaturase/sphingolipid hydroxylase (fatty acid hydroxylase superfamily)